jgi:hypothetical protein
MTPDVRRWLPAGSRAWTTSAALIVVLAVVLVAVGVLSGRGDGSTGEAAAATTTAAAPDAHATPPPISPSPTGPTADATALPPSQEPVPLDASTQVDEVTVSLQGIEAIQGTATGPGDVGGPALRVTVRLENATVDPLDLLGVSVGMTYGDEHVPASPLGDPSAVSFAGTLEPGGTAEGVYVFRVPADARDAVTVSVGYQPGAAYAVFTGAA